MDFELLEERIKEIRDVLDPQIPSISSRVFKVLPHQADLTNGRTKAQDTVLVKLTALDPFGRIVLVHHDLIVDVASRRLRINEVAARRPISPVGKSQSFVFRVIGIHEGKLDRSIEVKRYLLQVISHHLTEHALRLDKNDEPRSASHYLAAF